MKIDSVPVVIKTINPADRKEKILNVLNLFPVPILLGQFDEPLSDSLYVEPRLAVMINMNLHLLTLLPEREEGQIIYHTYLTWDDTNEQPSTPGDDGPPKDTSAVSGPDNGSREQVSGGDTPPNSEEVHPASGTGNTNGEQAR